MKKYISLLYLFILASCASVAGVEIDSDDTLFTILTATTIAVFILFIKAYIEYLFAKRLEKYKKSINKK